MAGRFLTAAVAGTLALGLACGGTHPPPRDFGPADEGADTPPEAIWFPDVEPVDLGRHDVLPDLPDVPVDLPADPLSDGSPDPSGDPSPEAVADPGPPLPPPCSVDAECSTGFCLPAPGGAGKACAASCASDTCPEGWSCRSLEIRVGVVARICLPGSDLCRPCRQDADCRPLGLAVMDVCVPLSDAAGSACGADCLKTGGCPEGYACTVVERPGKTWRQCLPEDGACACDPAWTGARTDCYRDNGLGRCRGERGCDGGVEVPCSAPEAVAETCNGRDDDCNGITDDGFLAGGLYATDDHCGDCATSCAGTVPNGQAGCRLVDSRPECRFLGCLPGFVEASPGVCTRGGRGPCGPCASDADCAAGLSCGAVGGAFFCLQPCDPAAPACGEGFACVAPSGTPRSAAGAGEGGAASVCLRATGGCGAPGTPCLADADCEDLDACTRGTCPGGTCAFAAASCDDGNPCTVDSCDRAAGCGHEGQPDTAPCSDGDPCTIGDACLAGACVPGPRPDCDDANPCTDDRCAGGECSHSFNAWSEACYDGPPGTERVGTCAEGIRRCEGGVLGSCLGEVLPGPEACDGRDNDCNGGTDEDCDVIGVDVRPVAGSRAGLLGASGGRADWVAGGGPGGVSSPPDEGFEVVLGFFGN